MKRKMHLSARHPEGKELVPGVLAYCFRYPEGIRHVIVVRGDGVTGHTVADVVRAIGADAVLAEKYDGAPVISLPPGAELEVWEVEA